MNFKNFATIAGSLAVLFSAGASAEVFTFDLTRTEQTVEGGPLIDADFDRTSDVLTFDTSLVQAQGDNSFFVGDFNPAITFDGAVFFPTFLEADQDGGALEAAFFEPLSIFYAEVAPEAFWVLNSTEAEVTFDLPAGTVLDTVADLEAFLASSPSITLSVTYDVFLDDQSDACRVDGNCRTGSGLITNVFTNDVAAVPLPGAMALFLTGGVGLLARRRVRKA